MMAVVVGLSYLSYRHRTRIPGPPIYRFPLYLLLVIIFAGGRTAFSQNPPWGGIILVTVIVALIIIHRLTYFPAIRLADTFWAAMIKVIRKQ